MNQTIKNIFLLILSIIVCWFLMLGSFIFAWEDDMVDFQESDHKWYAAKITQPWTDQASLSQKEINLRTQSLKQNTPVIANFWRLVSYLFLSPEWTQKNVLVQNGTDVTVSADAGIVSLYDLFAHYRIRSDRWSFRLDQITNGSFYIGHETDGKVSIYSIDGVARLIFLDKGTEMTNIVLFPGSYIHFDPKKNSSLKDADLFRLITTLDVNNNEVFEFVNPRVNIGDDRDTFFNYRLSGDAKTLFQILSLFFKARIDNVNLLKDYGEKAAYDTQPVSSVWLLNPAKINHQMLLELSGLLSQVVDAKGNMNDLVAKIGNIYNVTKDMNLEWPSAKKTIEQFLLDGRFALYGGATNTQYQEIYESIAKMIGIQIDWGNSKLLQNLSNIYSQNLFTQKKLGSNSVIKIDTYSQTATELRRTLEEGWIDQKDYFDIAIYAYNILNKTEISPAMMGIDTVSDTATYDLLTTFLYAGKKYISSVTDPELQKRTISGFSSEFYDHLLSTISHSLYKNFVAIEGWGIFLSSEYVKWVVPKLPEWLGKNIIGLNAILDDVAPSIQNEFFQINGDSDVAIRMKKELLRLKGFEKMTDPESYKNYVITPYKADSSEGLPLPLIDSTLSSIESFTDADTKILQTSFDISTDPRYLRIKEFFPGVSSSTITLNGDLVSVTNVPLEIQRPGKENGTILVSMNLENANSIKDVHLLYNNTKLNILADSMDSSMYTTFISQLPYYLDILDQAMVTLGSPLAEPVNILPMQRRVSIGNSTIYSVSIP